MYEFVDISPAALRAGAYTQKAANANVYLVKRRECF